MNLKQMAQAFEGVWRKPRAAVGPTSHDYAENRGPGHDYTFTPKMGGRLADAVGWGHGIEEGDFLLLKAPRNPDGKAKYRVDSISYFSDPRDMWSAKLSFVARQFCSQCRQESTVGHECPTPSGQEPR